MYIVEHGILVSIKIYYSVFTSLEQGTQDSYPEIFVTTLKSSFKLLNNNRELWVQI